ncbi:MAG: hypothetical protein ROO76_21150 [Terriglobia bacterium]|jgi:hypothetical protein|nr:hypothetical protein [Terriglobia bacterium]
MPFKVERSEFDPEDGFLYYVSFKPHLQVSAEEIKTRMPVEAAISVSETGELADLSFEIPKPCRNDLAMQFIRSDAMADYIEPKVLIAVPGFSGDAVLKAPAKLDLDRAGRIVGMEIQWQPGTANQIN